MPRLPAGGGPRAGVRCPDSIRAPGDRCGSRPRCRRPDAAAHQHGDAVGQGEHRLHVVLHQQDVVLPAQPVQQRGHGSDSCWLMPAMGSSSSSRVGRQASTMASSSWRSSPCASAPAGTSARRPRPASSRCRAGRFPQRRRRARRPPEAEAVAAPRLHRHGHVLQRGEGLEHRGDLVRARQPAPHAPFDGHAGHVHAVQQHPAAVRPRSSLSWPISVVLPALLGPITACSSPGRTSSDRSSVTVRPP